MHFRKETGALIEVFLMEPALPADYEQMFQTTGKCSWLCMVGNLKKWKDGPLMRDFEIKGKALTLSATMDRNKTMEKSGGTNYWVDFEWDNPEVNFAEILEAVGELPIPPYLNRATQESDKTTYQTVYSKIKGSVAAPTAGLHFTDAVLHDLDQKGLIPILPHYAEARKDPTVLRADLLHLPQDASADERPCNRDSRWYGRWWFLRQ